jgi:CRP-like cAMP-binding protein
MHFVNQGEVLLERVAEDGETVVLQRTRHGFVAEASLQADRYHCDALVAEDADVTRVPQAPLLQSLRDDTAFALRWIGMLNRELRRQRLQCERLSLKTVQERLLHLVRTEGGAEGLPIASGLKSLSREISVSHEALYRCVATLERQGLLVRTEGAIRTV